MLPAAWRMMGPCVATWYWWFAHGVAGRVGVAPIATGLLGADHVALYMCRRVITVTPVKVGVCVTLLHPGNDTCCYAKLCCVIRWDDCSCCPIVLLASICLHPHLFKLGVVLDLEVHLATKLILDADVDDLAFLLWYSRS